MLLGLRAFVSSVMAAVIRTGVTTVLGCLKVHIRHGLWRHQLCTAGMYAALWVRHLLSEASLSSSSFDWQRHLCSFLGRAGSAQWCACCRRSCAFGWAAHGICTAGRPTKLT